MYLHGAPVDFRDFEGEYRPKRLQLPTYPFQRQRYWVDIKSGTSKDVEVLDINQISILNLLHQGNIQQLTQQLAPLSTIEEKYLPQLLEVIVKKHQQELNTASIQDWLYQFEWQLKPRNKTSEHQPDNKGIWLIFSDSKGLGESLALNLEQQGSTCLLVYAGESYQRLERTWSISPNCIEDYQRLLHEACVPGVIRGIIHLWSLDLASDLSISTLEQAQILGCVSVMHLIQVLVQQNNLDATLPKLWLVTRGTISVKHNNTLSGVFQSPLWGMGKVIALEHPQLWGGIIDLASESTEKETSALLAEILDSQEEDYLALRSQERYVARLQPSNIKSQQAKIVPLSSDGTYLITGGLGALGLKVAQWMVEQGARYLVLIGRRDVANQAQETISQMESVGAKVLTLQADVSDKTDMMRVLARIKQSMPALQGIIHAAGVVGYQSIIEMNLNSLISVLRPKVLGGLILHQLTQDMKLDFFVGFSSIASVWGSKGQSHYAAANYFLDTLANYRRSLGLPGLSINWGPWAEVGMATGEAQQFLNRMGVKALQPEKALAALGVLLAGNCSQTTVVNVDWDVFKGIYEARRTSALLEDIKTDFSDNIKPQINKKSDILQKLESAIESERQAILIAYLQLEIATVLGTSELPDSQRGFFNMGMDSLMAVDLKARLENSFNVSLPTTLIFEFPTIQNLAEFLAKKLFKWESTSLNVEVKVDEIEDEEFLISEIEQLSEDEIEVSIAEKLALLESLI